MHSGSLTQTHKYLMHANLKNGHKLPWQILRIGTDAEMSDNGADLQTDEAFSFESLTSPEVELKAWLDTVCSPFPLADRRLFPVYYTTARVMSYFVVRMACTVGWTTKQQNIFLNFCTHLFSRCNRVPRHN